MKGARQGAVGRLARGSVPWLLASVLSVVLGCASQKKTPAEGSGGGQAPSVSTSGASTVVSGQQDVEARARAARERVQEQGQSKAAGRVERAKGAGQAIAQDPMRSLTREERAALSKVREDPAPEQIVKNTHYWISNEHNLYLWYPHIKDKGGAYLGVGTDQNYQLAAWSGAELLILMDFDRAVVDLHRAYGVVFGRAKTPQEFRQWWSPRRREELLSLLEEEIEDEARRKRSKRAAKVSANLVYRRFKRVVRQYEKREESTYLSDQDQYDHLRRLWSTGRVLALRGDLTADRTMMDVGKALTVLDVPLRVVYLSNAEQYFRYESGYRRNLVYQPFDEGSVILRTHPRAILGLYKNDKFHYNVQKARNFQRWLKTTRVPSAAIMMTRFRSRSEHPGWSVMDRVPPKRAQRKAPEVAEPPEELKSYGKWQVDDAAKK